MASENIGAETEILITTAGLERGLPDGGMEIVRGNDTDNDNQLEESKQNQELISEQLELKFSEGGREELSNLSIGVSDNHPKTRAHDEPIRHPPGSIMSLSTGSEESTAEEEKFVKVKPCEMESGSSKASSQCGKENLELEEQILHLNEQLEGLKEQLKGKDEECQNIKLQLEGVLLEKNVEAQSISTLTAELKSVKESGAARDEQLDEVNFVVDDLLDEFKSFLPPLSDTDHLDVKLQFLKQLQSHFQRLDQDMSEKEFELSESRSQLQALEDEQANIIGGYQLVTHNYENLQSEFEEYKLAVATETSESTQLREEFDRFREELISKDEDLMELQARCDEVIQNLERKTEELQLLRGEQQKLTESKKEDKSNETDPCPMEAPRPCSAHLYSDTSPVTPPRDQISSNIKKLKDHCIQNLQLSNLEQRKIKADLDCSTALNEQLSRRLSEQEAQMIEKDDEVKELLKAVQEYQSSIHQKTLEINETLTTKNLEIEHLMATYKSYADGKERNEAELLGVVEEKDRIIDALRTEREGLKLELEQVEALRYELGGLKSTFTTMEDMYLGKITNLMTDLDTLTPKLVTAEAQVSHLVNLNREQDVRIEALKQQSADASVTLREVTDLTSRLEAKGREVDHLRSELSRLGSAVENTKAAAKKEYEIKQKEDEILRESEIIGIQQEIGSLQRELTKVNGARVRAEELMVKMKGDNERLQTQVRGVMGEKEAMELEWHLVRDQLNWKNDQIVKLEAEAQDLHRQIQGLETSVNEQEALRVKAQDLESQAQKINSIQSQSEGKVIEGRVQQLMEEVRALNEASVGKDRKVELLQSKIAEIENSEMKAFEETFRLKESVKRLELENREYWEEIQTLSDTGNDANDNPKIVKIQEELFRLINALEERDKKSVQLALEITRLLDERDGLQLKLSSVLKHSIELTSDLHNQGPASSGDAPVYNYTDKAELQAKLAQLEDTNFRMSLDLKREREARQLVQEELLYSQKFRIYREREMKGRLGDPAKSPSPSDFQIVQSPPEKVGLHNPHNPTSAENPSTQQVVHI